MKKEIKIIQISDLHWRGNTRHEEYTKSFELLFEQLKEIKPDFIVCTGDVFHTKTQGLTNEVVERMAWMFRSLDKIAPVRTILGNHDGNLKNEQRQDAVTPIFEAIGSEPRNILYKKSGNYIEQFDDRINWCVFSCFDKENWNLVSPQKDKINIALYHGSISGCVVGSNHSLEHGEESISKFTKYDFGLFGDIHKTQFLSYRKDKNKKDKPWAGYPGSLIQQNHGEEEQKGFLLWTIRDTKDWDVNFIEVENERPFFTSEWNTSVKGTVDLILEKRKIIKQNSRIRIFSNKKISAIEVKQLTEILKKDYQAEEVSFKIDTKEKIDKIKTGNVEASKDNLRTNTEVIVDLYREFVDKNKKKNSLSEENMLIAEETIKAYIKKIEEDNPDESAKNVVWDLKKIEFDNVFRYGEGNCINFDNLSGIVGIFGPNRIGKSSIPGALMYGLFNTTDRGPMKNGHMIKEGTRECKAKVQFQVNEEMFFVERSSALEESKKKTIDDSYKTSTDLNFYKIDKEDNIVSLNLDDRDNTDKNIRKTIGTAEDFLMTSFSSQGDINRFINEGSTKRKELLSKFLNLDIFKTLSVIAKEDLNSYNAIAKKYISINFDQDIKDLGNQISENNSLLELYENKILETENKLQDIKTQLLIYEQKFDFDSLRTLERDLEQKEKEYQTIKNLKEETETNITNVRKQEINLKKQLDSLDIQSLEEKIEKMQSLRALAADIQASFKIETNTLEQQEKTLKKLTVVPCGDSYPTCTYIKDAHENKTLIVEQQSKVSELKNKLKDFELIAKEFIEQKIAEKYKESKLLTEQLTQFKNKSDVLNERFNNINLSKIIEEKNKINDKLNKTKQKINSDDLGKKEDLQESHKVLSSQMREFINNKNESLISVGSLNQKMQTAVLQKKELADLIEKTNIQQTVYNAFSKTGIPTMVLESQLPAINQELQKILAGVSDFQIEIVASSTSNAMDVYIINGTSRRIIETASGMEKMLCSLALRVALNNLSSMPKSNIFIIDEGFGVLDEQNISLCLQMLNTLKTYYKTILIITHISEVKEIVDNIIEIKDFNGESYVYI